MTERFAEVGRLNAEEALDQHELYGSVENAIDEYFVNVDDTLIEMGVTTWDARAEAAHDAFRAVLEKHKITHRPHGLQR